MVLCIAVRYYDLAEGSRHRVSLSLAPSKLSPSFSLSLLSCINQLSLPNHPSLSSLPLSSIPGRSHPSYPLITVTLPPHDYSDWAVRPVMMIMGVYIFILTPTAAPQSTPTNQPATTFIMEREVSHDQEL